ncbi:transcriptional regulator [Ensifer sp. YR511]|nr:transcriptional regulator [Ensifer sp. YR511]
MSGDRSPLYAGASNKLLLAAMSDAEIENYLANGSFRAFTENTIVDRASLWDEVASIRRQGYAESNSEKFLGGASLAAPIYNAERHIIAALSVSIPIERFDDAHKQRCLARIIEAAHSISSELGYRL